jgi:hypothetical protein
METPEIIKITIAAITATAIITTATMLLIRNAHTQDYLLGKNDAQIDHLKKIIHAETPDNEYELFNLSPTKRSCSREAGYQEVLRQLRTK